MILRGKARVVLVLRAKRLEREVVTLALRRDMMQEMRVAANSAAYVDVENQLWDTEDRLDRTQRMLFALGGFSHAPSVLRDMGVWDRWTE